MFYNSKVEQETKGNRDNGGGKGERRRYVVKLVDAHLTVPVNRIMETIVAIFGDMFFLPLVIFPHQNASGPSGIVNHDVTGQWWKNRPRFFNTMSF